MKLGKVNVPLGLIVVYLVLICFCFLMVKGLRIRLADNRKAMESKSWPTTEGVILTSSMKKVGKYHSADISFEYTVDETKYVSYNLSFGGIRGYQEIQEAVESHPAGMEVSIHSNPEDPGEAVLVSGIKSPIGGYLFAIILGIVLVILFTPILLLQFIPEI